MKLTSFCDMPPPPFACTPLYVVKSKHKLKKRDKYISVKREEIKEDKNKI